MLSSCFGRFVFLRYTHTLLTCRDDDYRETQLVEEDIPFIQDELDNVTTIFYMVVEGARGDKKELAIVRTKLRKRGTS